MTLEAFVRASGAVMGLARESFGQGGVFAAGGGVGGIPVAPVGASGQAADGADHESHRVHGDVTALGSHDKTGDGQLAGAVGAAGAGRGRMDSIIAAAVADVEALGLTTDTPQGQAALVAAIKRHLEDTKGTLDTAGADADTRAAGANGTTAGYNGTAPAVTPAAMPQAAQMLGSAVPAAVGAPASVLSSFGGGGLPLSLLGQPLSTLGQVGSLASGARGGGDRLASEVGPLADRAVGGDLPAGVGSERGLQVDTILAKRAVSAAFPEIKDIGGFRPDALPWHPNGQAIDCMLPNPGTPQANALGDAIVRFAMARKDQFHLNHICWRQHMYLPDGSVQQMEDRGGPTANHMDHVHIATNGGGYPHGGEVYRI